MIKSNGTLFVNIYFIILYKEMRCRPIRSTSHMLLIFFQTLLDTGKAGFLIFFLLKNISQIPLSNLHQYAGTY
jgi:hypothetical protein